MSSEVLVEPKGRVDFKEGEASGVKCSSQAKSVTKDRKHSYLVIWRL